MQILFNGESDVNGLVTLTENPNIVKIEDEAEGTFARITMLFTNNLASTVTSDGQYYITLFGETITSTNNPQNNNNKRFYISPDTASTAMNVARALRCLPNLSVQFKIIHNQNYATTVLLSAKTIGSKWSDFTNEVTTNIGVAYLQISNIAGTATNQLYDSKINLDIFDGSENVANYLTTLEKNFYNGECAFDISPVLATFSEYGESKPFHINLSAIGSEGNYIDLGEVSGNSIIGYSANYSDYYKIEEDGIQWLLNDTNCELYTYSRGLGYSLLIPSTTYNWQTTVSVKNSADVVIYSAETTNTFTHADGNIVYDKSLFIPQTAFTSGFSITIKENNDTKTFKIIKPLNATEGNNRVYWRNEYGGISFFDFTSEESEANNVEIGTYEKNILDFYDERSTNMYEVKKIYQNDYTKTITLKSHLISKAGAHYVNSLMKSKKVWVKLSDGHEAYIIPKSYEVQEDQTYNDIYTVKFSFTFSSKFE